MQNPNSDLRARWLQLQPESQTRILKPAPVTNDSTVPYLLGLAGKGGFPQAVIHALSITFAQALDTPEDRELPIFEVNDVDGQPSGIQTLHIGLIKLSAFFKFEGLGTRTEALGFIKHKEASEEEYSVALNAIIRRTNRILLANSINPIPTPGEYLYPLDKLQF